jgi:hypothetical protein
LDTPEYVNSTVDKIISLSRVEAFERSAKTAPVVHQVRVMAIYPGAPADVSEIKDSVGTMDTIARWSHKKADFHSLMRSLNLLASGLDGEAPDRIEQTKQDPEIIEIKDPGKRLRLFAFRDDDEVIILAGHYQKHGKARTDERRQQNKAISAATARKELYRTAKSRPDLYWIKKGD